MAAILRGVPPVLHLGQDGISSLYIDTLVAANSQPEAGELTKPGSCASILAAKEAGRINTWHFQLLHVCVGEEEFPTVIGNVLFLTAKKND